MVIDSGNDDPKGDVEKHLDRKLDESLESDVGRNVEQIVDSDSNSENGYIDFQLAREAFESIGATLPSLEFDILQTGLTSLIGVRNGVYDSSVTKKEFCNILQMENSGRKSVGRRRSPRRLVLIKKLSSCFHNFPIPSSLHEGLLFTTSNEYI